MQFEIREIELKDKPLFDRYFAASGGMNSEYTFTNMYMWRKSYNIRYALIHDMLCIFSQHAGSAQTANFPLGSGDIKPVIQKLLGYFEELGQRPLIRVYNESELKALNNAFPDTFIITEDRNAFDYVYKVSDLIELPGSRYHAKRNHINRFLAQYPYEYHKINDKYIDSCYEMFGKWCDSKEDTVAGISEQREAVGELLNNLGALNVRGGAITVDNRVVAFSFGELLNKENSIAVIHLEHADTDFQGSFPMINQKFLEHEWSGLTYVNREEDMGLIGLRQAKKSYHPCLMVKKLIASLK